MKEIRLKFNEDGLAEIYEPYITVDCDTEEDFKYLQYAIELASDPDFIKIVRCQDCRFWEESEIAWGSTMACSCPELNISFGGDLYPGMDFFCKYGQRREEHEPD